MKWLRGNDAYYQRSGDWICAKVVMNGEARYELWRGKERFPESGTYATFREADAVADLIEEMG